ncbi:MAG: type II secretion system F family protein [Candidatus Rifleibacteriota bacterium]
MKKYLVKVQKQDNSFEMVSIQAQSAKEALEIASVRGLSALEAIEEPDTSSSFNPGFGHVPASELYHFTRLFATLTRAGVPLLETLELLTNRASNTILKETLAKITNDVKEGNSLKASFAKHNDIFDRTYLQLMEVGEESGNLPQVLDRITQLLKKKIQLRGMIVKALTYPVLVLVLSTVVVAAILIKIVPRFKEIYAKFGGELPALTRFTLGCSDVLINYSPWIIGAALLIFALVYFGKRTASGKRIYDGIVLNLPLFGSMFHTYEIAGFAKSFSMLVHSGITVTAALDLIQQAIERVQVGEALKKANNLIKSGTTISKSFDAQQPWLPELLNKMVAVGERSGNLPEMLDHVAEFYEEEFNNKIETLASLIEPMLIVFLGVVIGGIVISLYLPIFGMAKLISRR